MRRVALVLGSNVEPERNVPLAVAALRDLGRVVACSGAWRSAPAGGATGPDFWNAAVLLDTELDPAALRSALRGVERRLGRRRPAPRLAPRPIDLDVVGSDGAVVPGEASRWAHVAVPLAEVAPGWVDASTGTTVAGLADALRGTTELVRVAGSGTLGCV